MTVELKAKSQVTIPSALVKSLALKQGDLFDVVEDHGRIILIPVVAYPREYVERLEREAKAAMVTGKEYESVDEMIASLESD